jgi:molybdopterin/thiamine biosynthesis adenylyltransferase
MPSGRPDTCANAGVVGPVVGVLGAIQAAIAIRLLLGDANAAGELWSYRALPGRLRRVRLAKRPDCALCTGGIRSVDRDRYAPTGCAA